MSRCTVCQLQPSRLNAIDAALRAGKLSLGEISSKTGLTRSSLHRHRQHLQPAQELTAARDEALTPTPATRDVSAVQPSRNIEPHPQPATKAELLQRLEYLWQESIDGLQETKKPIQVMKPNGEVVEIAGDLRSRPGFLREARSILELKATVNGDLTAGSVGSAILIVLPVIHETSSNEQNTVNIALPARSNR